MRFFTCITAALACACTVGAAAVTVSEGFTASALGQNFMGGFDYLPNGDLIGMYADPLFAGNSWIGIVDANGDGLPAAVEKVYDFGLPEWAGFVKVSPDGATVVFCESSNYRLFAMDLDDYSAREIVPRGGTFDGAFDLAFIDDSSCYVSANPAWGMTNDILFLEIASGQLKKVASVSSTYSGPLAADDEGSLYCVAGKAHYPVQAGDFTLLKFDAAKLAEAMEGGTVLGRSDAEVVKDGLDGGYGLAWHGSGDLFVSDANHGKIVRVSPGGASAEFVSLPGGDGEGFRVISIFDGPEPFSAGVRSDCRLATDYLPLPGAATPDIYRISSLPPLVNAVVSAKTLSAGSRLALTVTAQPETARFDAYIVFSGPGGIAYSVTEKGLPAGVKPYASAVPELAKEFKARVLDMVVPPAAETGAWTVYAGLMPAGTPPSPAAALALDTTGLTVR
ncbi:MAG: hypothetical protein WCP22_06955 [Chlamydiota bacterium]